MSGHGPRSRQREKGGTEALPRARCSPAVGHRDSAPQPQGTFLKGCNRKDPQETAGAHISFFILSFFPQGPPHWQKLDARELHALEETPAGMVKEGDKNGCDGSQAGVRKTKQLKSLPALRIGTCSSLVGWSQ